MSPIHVAIIKYGNKKLKGILLSYNLFVSIFWHLHLMCFNTPLFY